MRSIVFAVVESGRAHHGFFDGFGWPQGATIIAASIAATIAVIGYSIQRKNARRSERATLYGNALGAVEAYLEGPYRIRRKTNDPDNWFALSSSLSDVKTAISHHHALLEMHAPGPVVAAYKNFVSAALREAGPQMTAAWGAPPLAAPTDVPLGTGYARTDSDDKRQLLVEAMADDLKCISTWWRLSR